MPKKDHDVERMLAMWAAGKSQAEIGVAFGMSQTRVSQILKTTPGWTPNNRRVWTAERRQRAADLYLAGATLTKVAALLNTSTRHVRAALAAHGVKSRPSFYFKPGSANPMWTGGRTITKGYVYVHRPDHPQARKAGYVLESRLVMEAKLGRYLTREEVVHHKDDNPLNNHPDNLKLYPNNAAHLADTLKGKVPNWTPAGRAAIAAGVAKNVARMAAKRKSA